jgi:hypothetical protein
VEGIGLAGGVHGDEDSDEDEGGGGGKVYLDLDRGEVGKRNVVDGEEVADRIGKQATTGTAGREEEVGRRRAINRRETTKEAVLRMCPEDSITVTSCV